MSELAPLDFVYLDSNGDPFRVRKFGGDYWICRKHPDKNWVTVRMVESDVILRSLCDWCLDWKFHEVYEFGIPFTLAGWPTASMAR